MAVDHQNKQVFAGECKYHNKPVDATVYYELEEKVKKSVELRTAFPGYKVLYGLFSKSGFTQRMLDQAEGQDDILLIMGTEVISWERNNARESAAWSGGGIKSDIRMGRQSENAADDERCNVTELDNDVLRAELTKYL